MGMDETSMRDLVMRAGGAVRPSENRTSWLDRIAEEADLTYRVVRAAWHGEQMSSETKQKLTAVAEINEQAHHEIARDLERLAHRLQAANAQLHGTEINTLRHLADRVRNLDRRR